MALEGIEEVTHDGNGSDHGRQEADKRSLEHAHTACVEEEHEGGCKKEYACTLHDQHAY